MFGNNVADAGISACTFQLAGVTCPPAWRVNGWACKHFLLSQGVQCLDQSRLWLLSNYDYLSTIYCHFQEHRGRPENEGMVQNFPGSLTSGPKTEWMIFQVRFRQVKVGWLTQSIKKQEFCGHRRISKCRSNQKELVYATFANCLP